MHVQAIINPTSGGRRALRQWYRVRAVLEQAGWQIEERISERRGHARDLAAGASARVVLAAGGDGTAHEVANGLLQSRRGGVMAVLPLGTGNDFARALGLPRDPLAAAAMLIRCKPRALDVGEVNGRYFLTISGVGFDGEVARQVNAWPKVLSAVTMYGLGILKTLVTYRPVEASITANGFTERERLFLLAVANTAWNAGGMWLVPQARPDDGFLHAVIAGPLTRLETLLVLPKVFSGGHLGHPKVRAVQAREIRVTSEVPLAIQADGEAVGTIPAVFRVHPGALPVLAPVPEPTPGAR
ncbi:MAG: diacylglycerol kinase family lipid kinase [Armatimonadota bacterium]|nr:diacylglycerol kinase family lipid kinase [Armatimonadota bacterium]